jgi:hypothetical protein
MAVRRLVLFVMLPATVWMGLSCRSINIKTGPPTDTELTRQSEDRGREFRVMWSERLQQASPVQQALMMRTMLDSTTAQFIRFGYQVLDMWKVESDRRGVQLTPDEVRTAIEQANQFDLPVLEAYEDVVEFGIDLITTSEFFDSPARDRLTEYRNLYYEVYNSVFYPRGGLQDYERELQAQEAEIAGVSAALGEELDRY